MPSSPDDLSTKTPFRVAIIGGGIGGLVLAQLLRADRRYAVTVYERGAAEAEAGDLAGFRIFGHPSIIDRLQSRLNAEAKALLRDAIGETPPGGHKMCLSDHKGNIILRYVDPEMRASVAVSRWKLRKALLVGASNFVRFGMKFERYEKREADTKIIFESGESVICDLVVGSDGAGSRVRRQLVPQSTRTDTGVTVIYFKMPLTPETHKLMPFGSGCMALGPRRSMVVSIYQDPKKPYGSYNLDAIEPEDSFLMCGLGCYTNEFLNQAKHPDDMTPEELKEECMARVQTWHPLYRALVALAVPQSVYMAHIKTQDRFQPWASGPVTLLGDAAHSMTPYLGKGANTTIVDAMDLAEALVAESGPPLLERLRDYEKEMLQRGFSAISKGMKIHNLVFYYGDTPWRALIRNFLLWLLDLVVGVPDTEVPLQVQPNKFEE